MNIIKNFKDFAVKGNVVDMAVGIIIGAAFGKIVTSLVADIIMPPIGLLIGGVDFSHLVITLKPAVGAVPAVVISYGKFIQTVLDFTIVAFAIFMMIGALNKLRQKHVPPPSPPSAQETLLAEIRDLLRAQNAKPEKSTISKNLLEK